MDDPATMRGTQAKGDVVGNNDGAIKVQHSPGTQVATQIGGLYQSHDDIIVAIGLSVVVDLYNIGVLQGRRSLRFELEALHKLRVGAIDFAQHLDGDDAIHTHIAAAINDGHATFPYGVLKLVSNTQNFNRLLLTLLLMF